MESTLTHRLQESTTERPIYLFAHISSLHISFSKKINYLFNATFFLRTLFLCKFHYVYKDDIQAVLAHASKKSAYVRVKIQVCGNAHSVFQELRSCTFFCITCIFISRVAKPYSCFITAQELGRN